MIILNSLGPIKFSTATNLSDQECRELLLKYMPTHIKETKISQKLFVQYVLAQSYKYLCLGNSDFKNYPLQVYEEEVYIPG